MELGQHCCLAEQGEALRDHAGTPESMPSNSGGFSCRMFTSYHRQFSTWLILKLSSALKNAVAIREVTEKRALWFAISLCALVCS